MHLDKDIFLLNHDLIFTNKKKNANFLKIKYI